MTPRCEVSMTLLNAAFTENVDTDKELLKKVNRPEIKRIYSKASLLILRSTQNDLRDRHTAKN